MDINESIATSVNGKISGQVTNENENESKNSYLKIDLYNKRDRLMGTKYVDISNLENGEKKDFSINYNYKDINKYAITTIDNVEEGTTKIASGAYDGIAILIALIVLQTVI